MASQKNLSFVSGNWFLLLPFVIFVVRNATAVDTLRGMVDLSLLFYAWLTVTFAVTVVSLPHLLHSAYNLQVILFPS
jgi:hypothetical protein